MTASRPDYDQRVIREAQDLALKDLQLRALLAAVYSVAYLDGIDAAPHAPGVARYVNPFSGPSLDLRSRAVSEHRP